PSGNGVNLTCYATADDQKATSLASNLELDWFGRNAAYGFSLTSPHQCLQTIFPLNVLEISCWIASSYASTFNVFYVLSWGDGSKMLNQEVTINDDTGSGGSGGGSGGSGGS